MSENGLQELALAIETDHPCYDFDCDIATALREGFVIASAILLIGATETPTVDAVIERYGIDLGSVHDESFQRWVDWHREYGRLCEACDSFNYVNPDTGFEPSYCGNCLAELSPKGGNDE